MPGIIVDDVIDPTAQLQEYHPCAGIMYRRHHSISTCASHSMCTHDRHVVCLSVDPVCAGSCFRSSTLGCASSPSELAADFKSVSTQVASALSRHQQQEVALNSQMAGCQQQLAGWEGQLKELRDRLAAAEAAQQVGCYTRDSWAWPQWGWPAMKAVGETWPDRMPPMGFTQIHDCRRLQLRHIVQQVALVPPTSEAKDQGCGPVLCCRWLFRLLLPRQRRVMAGRCSRWRPK